MKYVPLIQLAPAASPLVNDRETCLKLARIRHNCARQMIRIYGKAVKNAFNMPTRHYAIHSFHVNMRAARAHVAAAREARA